MKKKVTSFVLLLLAVFALSSCNTQNNAAEGSFSSVTVSQSQTEMKTEALTSAGDESGLTSKISETATEATSPSSEISSSEKTETKQTVSTSKEETTVTETILTSSERTASYCTVTIDCRNAKKNLSKLKKSKRAFVPESGYILKNAEVEVLDGDTAFDVFKRACAQNVCTDNCKYCQKNHIQAEYSFTPAYNSYYIEGIHQLYEKDCGSLSGWMFSVNGTFPDVASSAFEVKAGDSITFAYTVSMGDDL